MIFDKEKLLSVYDQTCEKEPMRSRRNEAPSVLPSGKDH